MHVHLIHAQLLEDDSSLLLALLTAIFLQLVQWRVLFGEVIVMIREEGSLSLCGWELTSIKSLSLKL